MLTGGRAGMATDLVLPGRSGINDHLKEYLGYHN